MPINLRQRSVLIRSTLTLLAPLERTYLDKARRLSNIELSNNASPRGVSRGYAYVNVNDLIQGGKI